MRPYNEVPFQIISRDKSHPQPKKSKEYRDKQLAAFLESGGVIQQIPRGVSGYKNWLDKTQITQSPGRPRK